MSTSRQKIETLVAEMLALRAQASTLRRNPEAEILAPRPGLDDMGLERLSSSWHVAFPPSYCDFLLAFDGWKNADGQGTDLLGSEDRREAIYLRKIEEFKKAMATHGKKIKSVDDLWCVAVRDVQFLYLDSTQRRPDGEMDLVLSNYDGGEVMRYPTMTAWFEGKLRLLRGLIEALRSRAS